MYMGEYICEYWEFKMKNSINDYHNSQRVKIKTNRIEINQNYKNKSGKGYMTNYDLLDWSFGRPSSSNFDRSVFDGFYLRFFIHLNLNYWLNVNKIFPKRHSQRGFSTTKWYYTLTHPSTLLFASDEQTTSKLKNKKKPSTRKKTLNLFIFFLFHVFFSLRMNNFNLTLPFHPFTHKNIVKRT